MIEHYLQRRIVATLVEYDTARFADLKPQSVDSNQFTYHLQTLIKQKFITKTSTGKYELTSKGKLYAINSSLDKQGLLHQAHSIILLSIRDGNKWLLRRRLVQPLYGKIGFIHGEPMADEKISDAASRILQRRTELSGEPVARGSGYVCLKQAGDIVAYSHFTLFEVHNIKGDLKESDAHGENIWLESPDFSSPEMIPSMQQMVSGLEKAGLFFLDLTYDM